MKKLLLILVLLNISFNSFCQEEEKKENKSKSKKSSFQGTKYGVRFGFNTSRLNFDETPEFENKSRNSFYIGFFAELGFSKNISVMPEIQFSPEGARLEAFHLDYLQVPILVKYKINEKFRFGLGPKIGLNTPKVEDGLKDLGYSGVACIEYKITHTIFADIRYSYGFSNVFDEDQSSSAQNSNIQVGIGYKF